MLFELGERSNAVLELPFPIVPKFARHTGPKARCMRDELFSIAISKRLHFEVRTKTLRPVGFVSTRAPASAPRTRFGSDFDLLNCDDGADRDFGKKLPGRF